MAHCYAHLDIIVVGRSRVPVILQSRPWFLLEHKALLALVCSVRPFLSAMHASDVRDLPPHLSLCSAVRFFQEAMVRMVRLPDSHWKIFEKHVNSRTIHWLHPVCQSTTKQSNLDIRCRSQSLRMIGSILIRRDSHLDFNLSMDSHQSKTAAIDVEVQQLESFGSVDSWQSCFNSSPPMRSHAGRVWGAQIAGLQAL